MNTAACRFKGKPVVLEMERDILSGNCNEEDITDIRCTRCNAPAHIAHTTTREWHFRAHHEPDCPIVNDGQEHRAYRVNNNIIIDDIVTIFHYRDHAPANPGPGPINPGTGQGNPEPHPDIDDIDSITVYGTRLIHSVGGIYSYVRKEGLDSDIGNGLTGRDLFLTARTLRDVRRNGMYGMKIAITKRIYTKNLEYPINIPEGYICLADNYAEEMENAVFFLVRIARNDQNDVFRSKVTGDFADPSIKDKHDNILVLGNWHEHPNDFYNVYISEPINTKCYKFVNFREFKS